MPLFFAFTVLFAAPGLIEAALRARRPHLWSSVAIALLSLVVAAPLVSPSNWPLLVSATTALLVASALLLVKMRDRELARTIVLAATLVVAVTVFGSVSLVPGFNDRARAAATTLATTNRLFATMTADRLHTLLVAAAGLLLVTVELNHPIALILRRRRLLPDDTLNDARPRRSTPTRARRTPRRPDEAARGRVIGYLERAIVFVIIVAGTFESLGLVLVAKGIARFQQLQDRDFAEYFLIGTLLSIAAALAVGFAARALL